MSLVVVNVSAGPSVVTLPSISSVPGRILTVKDNGSASATNIATLTPTVGESFESGVATYLLYTPFAYVIFIGNATTLKWRVLDSSYPDIPMNIPPTPPTPGTLGGVTGSLTNLTVSGLTSLGNSSNTGNLGVAGTTTLASVSATNINFTGGLYSNGVIFSGGSASPNFSTISTIGQAAFYSSVQVQGSLSVFSSLTARNINFTGLLTSNGTTFSGTPAGINSAGSIGIGAAAGATTLLVTGTQSNTGTLGVAGATTLSGTLGVTGLTTLVNSSNTGTLGVAGNATVTGTLAVTGGFTGRLINDSWIYSTDGVPRFLFYGSSSSVYRSFDRHDFRNSADTVIVNIDNAGNLTANGSITGSSKNFRIDHPTLSGCTLTHASIEGPRYDLIYRNRKQLVNGIAEVDIEKESTSNGATMTAGTFDALATNPQVFLQNNDSFDRVKGHVSSQMLFIECENSNSSAFVDWMVTAERHDPHVVDSEVTDANGFLVLERYTSNIPALLSTDAPDAPTDAPADAPDAPDAPDAATDAPDAATDAPADAPDAPADAPDAPADAATDAPDAPADAATDAPTDSV